MYKILLSVKCDGLEVHSKSPLLSQGFFARVAGPPIARNVKKIVRIQKSEAFLPGGRPPSLIYDQVFESEVFEDDASIGPSLIAEIMNSTDKDCKLRVNVYYSSSLTNTKEILFAGTSFNLRDVTRSNKPVYTSAMVSEHCLEPVAYVRIVPALDAVLCTRALSSCNAPTEWNPMFRRYIFHPDIAHSNPVLCEEFSWEPRLALDVPLVFLQSFADIMTGTIGVWNLRAQLERVRQGRFLSREEAFMNGWFEVSISVSGCRVTAMSSERRSSDDRTGIVSGDGPAVDLRQQRSISGSRADSANKRAFGPMPRMPSSYVEVILEHRSLIFDSHIGRTNTEHNTLFPMYGSNINLGRQQQKGPGGQSAGDFQLSPLASAENVRITKIPHEFRVDPLVLNSTSHGMHVVEPALGVDAGQPKIKRGTKNIFHVFTPFGGGKGGRVRLELMFEDPSSKGIAVGVCYVDLEDVVVRDRLTPNVLDEVWVPVTVHNSGADNKWVVCTADILVGVTIQQQQPQRKAGFSLTENLPAVNPASPATAPYDPELDSVAFNSVVRTLATAGDAEKVETYSNESKQQESRRPNFSNFSDSRLTDSDDESDDEDEVLDSTMLPQSSVKDSGGSSVRAARSVEPLLLQDISGTNCLPTQPPGMGPDKAVSGCGLDMRRAALRSDRITAECYEWMWHIGFKGIDPLSISPLQTESESPDQPAGSEVRESRRGQEERLPRVDVNYSTTWLNKHIATLEELLCHVKCLIAFYSEDVAKEGNRFRPSKLKKEIEYQALPVNLHIQLMVLQRCENAAVASSVGDNSGKSAESTVRVVDSVTCGAMSPHGLGFKNGGLNNIEQNLQRSKSNLDALKAQYATVLKGLDNITDKLCFSSHGKEAELRDSLGRAVMAYETATADVSIRRMYSLSQVLSTSVNSFLYKLELVVEGHIPSFFLDRWLTHGYLILFECLLSVNGKERGMIEDSRTAVDMLSLYSIRLLPSPQSDSQLKSSSPNLWLADEIAKSSERSGYTSKWWETIECDKAAVRIMGREALLFLPDEIINTFADNIRTQIYTTGCKVALHPVLFSQGIDIMQSITNTWDSSEAGLSSRDLQLQINISGLRKLNTYCELVQPINSRSVSQGRGSRLHSFSDESGYCQRARGASNAYSGLTEDAHPLTGILQQLIQCGDPAEKNVEMLLEIERICRMLGGCRVTFCKSGKDRTGMAITLEQSRLLGENFDCGQSIERIMRDASTMRQYGTRLMVAEKNIGKAVYAINRLQIQFLPLFYRPPVEVAEELIKKTDNS